MSSAYRASASGSDKWTFIPSKGGAQALQDVAGGHADLLFNSMLATAPHVKSGTVRLITVIRGGGLKIEQ